MFPSVCLFSFSFSPTLRAKTSRPTTHKDSNRLYASRPLSETLFLPNSTQNQSFILLNMSFNSSRASSTKKVSIIYGESPRTSYDSLASQSSSANSARHSASTMTSSNGTRYDGYANSTFSRSSNCSAIDRLVRDPEPSRSISPCNTLTSIQILTISATASPHGYYKTDRTHSTGKKVTVHNHGTRSSRDDEPRTSSSYKR